MSPPNIDWSGVDAVFDKDAFFKAVKKGRLHVVKNALVANPHWLDETDRQYRATPLIWAAYKGHESLADFLLTLTPDVHKKDQYGDNALICAIRNNKSFHIIQTLMDHGANPNHDNYEDEHRYPIIMAVNKKDLRLAKELLKNQSGTDYRDKDGDTVWHYVAHTNQLEMCDLLLTCKSSRGYDQKNDRGQAPIHIALTRGNPEIAKKLILDGANVEVMDKAGSTPIIYAAYHGHAEIADLLAFHGADIYHMNNDGNTAFDLAKKRRHSKILKVLNHYNEGKKKMFFGAHKAVKKITEDNSKIDGAINDLKDLLEKSDTHKKYKDLPIITASSLTNDKLTRLIKSGNVDNVRTFFDSAFWQQKNTRPTWDHLQEALSSKNKPMMKILVTWGAAPTKDEWETFKSEKGDDYLADAFLLRSAGVKLYDLPKLSLSEQKELTAKFNAPKKDDPLNFTVKKIPDEWKTVLSAFQDNGAPEAGIAGGALRDLYNNKPIKDVDIFLLNQGSEKANYKLIQKIFKQAKVKTHDKVIHTSTYFSSSSKSVKPTPKIGALKHEISIPIHGGAMAGGHVHTHDLELRTESWHIRAGDQKTDYNIVFINNGYTIGGTSTIVMSSLQHSNAATAVLQNFDMGICQIVYDGKKVHCSKQYTEDVKNKTITWTGQNSVTYDHLKRVMDKYPDHTICKDLKKNQIEHISRIAKVNKNNDWTDPDPTGAERHGKGSGRRPSFGSYDTGPK